MTGTGRARRLRALRGLVSGAAWEVELFRGERLLMRRMVGDLEPKFEVAIVTDGCVSVAKKEMIDRQT